MAKIRRLSQGMNPTQKIDRNEQRVEIQVARGIYWFTIVFRHCCVQEGFSRMKDNPTAFA